MAVKNPPHPGLSVKRDCLDPLGLTVTAAAKLLGVTRQTLHDLVHARRGISPEMASRLDLVFGGGADTWLRMQTTYDLDKARLIAKDRIKVKRALKLRGALESRDAYRLRAATREIRESWR
jgi:antitoxin HigA-1